MSKTAIDAGRLTERVQVLRLTEKEPGVWSWEPERPARAQIELSTKRSLFSDIGIGARSAEIVLRRQAISLHNALLWGGTHLFLTSIVPEGRTHLRVEAALVEPVMCLGVRTEDGLGEGNRPENREVMRIEFPGVLTEKYLRHESEDTHAETDITYVLVLPKPIVLKAGDLVTVKEGPAKAVYNVTSVHVLDPYKNEVEMAFRSDV